MTFLTPDANCTELPLCKASQLDLAKATLTPSKALYEVI